MLIHISPDFSNSGVILRACELYFPIIKEYSYYFFIQKTNEYEKIYEFICYVGIIDEIPPGTVEYYKSNNISEVKEITLAALAHCDEIFDCGNIDEVIEKLRK